MRVCAKCALAIESGAYCRSCGRDVIVQRIDTSPLRQWTTGGWSGPSDDSNPGQDNAIRAWEDSEAMS